MTEEILQKIKREFERRKEQRIYLSKLIDEIAILEEDDNVKKYIKLKQELSKIDYKNKLVETDMQILDSTFYSHRYMIKTTNDIYVCMGTFMMDNICDIEHGPGDIRLKRDDPRAEYRIYKNIENEESKIISIRKCDEFEKTYRVIIPSVFRTEKYFYELQREFITTAIEVGQEEACRKVLNRSKK